MINKLETHAKIMQLASLMAATKDVIPAGDRLSDYVLSVLPDAIEEADIDAGVDLQISRCSPENEIAGDKRYRITSQAVPGLSLASNNLCELLSSVPHVIAKLDKLNGSIERARPHEDMILVPRRFVSRILDLAHNWSLDAIPPEYYSFSPESCAFRDAYRRCGGRSCLGEEIARV